MYSDRRLRQTLSTSIWILRVQFDWSCIALEVVVIAIRNGVKAAINN